MNVESSQCDGCEADMNREDILLYFRVVLHDRNEFLFKLPNEATTKCFNIPYKISSDNGAVTIELPDPSSVWFGSIYFGRPGGWSLIYENVSSTPDDIVNIDFNHIAIKFNEAHFKLCFAKVNNEFTSEKKLQVYELRITSLKFHDNPSIRKTIKLHQKERDAILDCFEELDKRKRAYECALIEEKAATRKLDALKITRMEKFRKYTAFDAIVREKIARFHNE